MQHSGWSQSAGYIAVVAVAVAEPVMGDTAAAAVVAAVVAATDPEPSLHH